MSSDQVLTYQMISEAWSKRKDEKALRQLKSEFPVWAYSVLLELDQIGSITRSP